MPKPPRIRISIRTSIARLGIAATIIVALYGCSVQAPTPPPAPYVPPPSPVVTAPREVGRPKVTTASFYAPEFQGHVTSSGEVYNQHEMTAASKTLPLGSHAKVTNLKTGKSVVVRINDHGPFVRGRGIDLSRAAAHKIGIDHHAGVAKVRVAKIEKPSRRHDDSSAHETDMRSKGTAIPADHVSKPIAPDSAGLPSIDP
jgi:rare lipoprotein A